MRFVGEERKTETVEPAPLFGEKEEGPWAAIRGADNAWSRGGGGETAPSDNAVVKKKGRRSAATSGFL